MDKPEQIEAEDAAWKWLDAYAAQRHGEAAADVTYSADQMVDAYIAAIEAMTPSITGEDTELIERLNAIGERLRWNGKLDDSRAVYRAVQALTGGKS